MERTTRNILPRLEPGVPPVSPIVEARLTPNEPPFKRRCISTACMPCRKRKSKCDGIKPSCFACLNTYSSPCYYDIDSDHRRKGALKRDIAQLKGELGAQTVILEAIKRGSDADIDDIINLVRANPDETYESIADNIQKMSLGARQKLGNTTGGTMLYGLEGELANLSSKPNLDKTGDLTRYGHTSNLYYPGTNEEQVLNTGDQMGSWTTVTNDVELINHLLDLYFTWLHPFYLIFSEEVFYHGLRDRKLKYCTPLLMNALLALGCVYSDRPEAKADPKDPSTRGSHFFAEAKRLLEGDDRSSLTTVQALGAMSIRQAIHDYDSSGWQYASQMMGMTVQLGLHIESAAGPNMTASEIEARRVTLWGVFSLQTCWSVCVGRIPALPRAAIRLEKPGMMQHMETRLWKPHGLPGWDGKNEALFQPSHKYSILIQNSLLSEILDDILHMFYAPKDRITSRKLQYFHEKLQTWYKNLPDTLQINENGPTLPQVYTLHMYYHCCVIHLFRPFLKVSFLQTSKTPRQICTERANTISHLMHQFIGAYSVERAVFIQSHCVVSAGIIHLVDISSTPMANNPVVREQSEMFLAASIRQLHSIKSTYLLVGRYLQALVGLTHKWCSVIPKRVQEAIVDSEIESPPPTMESSAHNNLPIHTTNAVGNGFPKPEPMSNPRPTEFGERKHSAPDLVEMAPRSRLNTSNPDPPKIRTFDSASSTPSISSAHTPSHQQQLFWTPFPDNFDGVPLLMPSSQHHVAGAHGMSVTGMLGGEFPHLNQDGFTIEHQVHIGGGGVVEAMPFWGQWEGGLS